MAAYRIEFTRSARKELARLPTKDRVRVAVAIDLLSENPRPPRCRPVQDAPQGTYRIRVGGYRVIYAIQDDVLLIAVVRIRRRAESTYNRIA